MLQLTSLRNMITTGALLFVVVPAVDGGIFKSNNEKDKAPLNRHVKTFVKNYIQENRKNLNSIKLRSSSPFIIIDSVFTKYGLPVQLKYLAVVESELKTKAVSKVGAVGPWQLMPATARILGLKVNSRLDERKNYYKSTRAAARYLKDLHEEFGDWFLVFAAYNSGEGTVNAAIRQSKSRNYWVLQQYLPEETKEYVKKFIATCYYFEGVYNPTLLSKTKDVPYAGLSKTLTNDQSINSVAKELSKQKNETSEEKFNRILKESEESLQKSNQLLRNIK